MGNCKLIWFEGQDFKKEVVSSCVVWCKQNLFEQMNVEEYYYFKQMLVCMLMVIQFVNDEEIVGWIEWYDKNLIKVNCFKGFNLFILKYLICYFFKEEECC